MAISRRRRRTEGLHQQILRQGWYPPDADDQQGAFADLTSGLPDRGVIHWPLKRIADNKWRCTPVRQVVNAPCEPRLA